MGPTTPYTFRRDSAMMTNIRAVTWADNCTETARDESMHTLLSIIEDGLPDTRKEMPQELQNYFTLRDRLNTFEGVILYKDRIVITPSLRQRILDSLHSAHQGITSMTARAEASVYWPGITIDIQNLRYNCYQCNRNAPSQPHAPPIAPSIPTYPFQMICADYFHYRGQSYCVIVDRYSNWPIVEKAKDGADGLITSLRKTFVTFGICEQLTSDGGPEFRATKTERFLKDWGVQHRISSVAYPHGNCRAEVAVKATKRLLIDNTSPTGSLDTNAFQRAMLQYRNTPDKETGISPAQCIFGRSIRDFIPVIPSRYNPHPTWRETLSAREEALRHRHLKMSEKLTEHTKLLQPLKVGDLVRIQNQTGPHPMKWDKTGTVVEVRQYDQYVVKVHGSGRVTLRNRKFLRKYTPAIPAAVTTPFFYDSIHATPKTIPRPATFERKYHPMDKMPAIPLNPGQSDPQEFALQTSDPSNCYEYEPAYHNLPDQPGTPAPQPQHETLPDTPIPVTPLPNNGPNLSSGLNPDQPKAPMIPLALRRLAHFNKPGLQETAVPLGRNKSLRKANGSHNNNI